MTATDFATALLAELATLVDTAKAALSPAPDLVLHIAPGESVAWDENCDGMLWVRVGEVRPPDTVVMGSQNPLDPCRSPYFVLRLELGVIRCAAPMSEDGTPPSAAQITGDGEQAISDMAALLGVLRCWDGLRAIESWTPRGPEGGYHGGYWTFTTRMSNCLGGCAGDHG